MFRTHFVHVLYTFRTLCVHISCTFRTHFVFISFTCCTLLCCHTRDIFRKQVHHCTTLANTTSGIGPNMANTWPKRAGPGPWAGPRAAQRWRSYNDTLAAGASVAQPLGPGPHGSWPRPWPLRPGRGPCPALGPDPSPLWPCIGHVRVCFQVFVHCTFFNKSTDLGSRI